jgi:uncharacterized protein (TIGR02145 family)
MKGLPVSLYLLFLTTVSVAQIKTGMTFQAVAYNNQNKLLTNQPIAVRFTFLREGVTLYAERHTLTTSSTGLFTTIVGSGTPESGAFSDIPWIEGSIRLRREFDFEGGTNYTIIGEEFIYSIPYAHVALKSLESPPSYAIDIHGQFIPTIKVGELQWTAANLSVTHYRDGTAIPASHVFVYDDSEANASKYGRLYSWTAVNSGKLCPVGWRVPTKADWESLLAVYSGKSLKAVVDTWTTNADNQSSFSGVPGGIADGNGGYDGKGDYTYIWTATEVSGSSAAWSVVFLPNTDIASLDSNNDKTFGMAVRCVK